MITQECPECTLIEQRKAEKDALVKECEEQKLGKDETKEVLQPVNDWLKSHNADRKWHLAVKDMETGQFTTLQITNKTKKKVDAKINSLLTGWCAP